MLPRELISAIAAVNPAVPVMSVADPRQQAFQRALAPLLGKDIRGEVLARLADGSFVVKAADIPARMLLPPGTQVGADVRLTLIALQPRVTFEVGAQAASVFTEAGPPLAEGADPSKAPLAYREGVPIGHVATLPAQGPTAFLAGAQSDQATLSPAGRAIAGMLAAAAKADPMTGLVSHAPVLGGPSADPAAIAAGLQQSVGKSGLFYESHVAEWAQGTRPLAELAAEPQQQAARNADKPALTDPATAQFINLQLATHEQARIAWQGQLWPGQELRWEIARDAPERDQAGREAGDGDGAGSWQSSLKLRLGKLGEVAAKVVLSGGQLHIRLDAPESARELLEAGSARLAEALDAAGTPLTTLAILGAADADE